MRWRERCAGVEREVLDEGGDLPWRRSRCLVAALIGWDGPSLLPEALSRC